MTQRSSSPAGAPRPDPRGPEGGLSLVEVLIALTVLMVGLGAFLRGLTASFQLSAGTRDFVLATHAARATMERLGSEDFGLVFARYNTVSSDDPVGPAPPGSDFEVAGLDASEDDADGMVGEILFPVDPADGGRLTELATSGFPGMPLDLNLDGDATDANVTADASLLPVVVRLRWRGADEVEQRYEIRAILVEP